MARFSWIPIILIIGFLNSLAAASADQPVDGENFSQFFQRITSGNHRYRGISFDASELFQNSFLPRYNLNSWVGDQQIQERSLEKSSIDLWGDWYINPAPAKIVLLSDSVQTLFAKEFERQRALSCVQCRSIDALWAVEWSKWTVSERALFSTTYVLQAQIFAGRRLIDFVADNYSVGADAVIAALDVKILPHADFVVEVRRLGWTGDVYFRGITGPEPQSAQRIEVLLDGDFLRDRSENTIPLFQMLEYAGILTHELNHVFQTLESRQMGFDLQIQSIEGAVLIEGSAEYLAEHAMHEAAVAGGEASLELYVTQQAIGLMDKDAEKDYEFLPYKIGLPFVFSLYQNSGREAGKIRTEMYHTILGDESLTTMVQQIEGK